MAGNVSLTKLTFFRVFTLMQRKVLYERVCREREREREEKGF